MHDNPMYDKSKINKKYSKGNRISLDFCRRYTFNNFICTKPFSDRGIPFKQNIGIPISPCATSQIGNSLLEPKALTFNILSLAYQEYNVILDLLHNISQFCTEIQTIPSIV